MTGDLVPRSLKPFPSLNVTDHSDKKMPAMDPPKVKTVYNFERRPTGRLNSESSGSSAGTSSTSAKRGGLIHKLRHPPTDRSKPGMTRLEELDESACSSAITPMKSNRTKQTDRFRSDASAGSVHSVDKPIQLPQPSYRLRPEEHPHPHPRRSPDYGYTSSTRHAGGGTSIGYHGVGVVYDRYGDDDNRRYYEREHGDHYARDRYDPHLHDNHHHHHGRESHREYYERASQYRRGDDRFDYDDRRYEPRYDPGGRHYDPRYDDWYDATRRYDDEYYHTRDREDRYHSSRYQNHQAPYYPPSHFRYERDYEPRRDPRGCYDPYEPSHRRRESDYDVYQSSRRYPDDDELYRYQSRPPPHHYDYDDDDDDANAGPNEPSPQHHSSRSLLPEEESEKDESEDEEQDNFHKVTSKAAPVLKRASLKDDAAYDEPASRPGAFHATGTGRTKKDKLAAAEAADDEPVYIEVFPGVSERLRRTKETKEAVRSDCIAPAVCFVCNTDVFCIADVKYYICPKCKCVSLLSESKYSGERKDVGIAFGLETLVKMQSEIRLQK